MKSSTSNKEQPLSSSCYYRPKFGGRSKAKRRETIQGKTSVDPDNVFPFDEQVGLVATTTAAATTIIAANSQRKLPEVKTPVYIMQTAESLRALSCTAYKPSDIEKRGSTQESNRENRKAACSRMSTSLPPPRGEGTTAVTTCEEGVSTTAVTTSPLHPRDRVVNMHSQPTSRYRLEWIHPLPTVKCSQSSNKHDSSLAPAPPTPLSKSAPISFVSTTSSSKNCSSIKSIASTSATTPTRNGKKNKNKIRSASFLQTSTSRQDLIVIGPPQLKLFRWSLPPTLLPLFDPIIARSEEYAKSRAKGWETNLYSLTRQDIPLALIPGGMDLAQPLTDLILAQIRRLYHEQRITLDPNQPHILKYDATSHPGVPIHYDRCDVTAQLMLSKASDYEGGGTLFPDLKSTIRLDRAELLMHPGNLMHAGQPLTSGNRYLLIWFCQFG